MNVVQKLLVLLILTGSLISVAWLTPEKNEIASNHGTPSFNPINVLKNASVTDSLVPMRPFTPMPLAPLAAQPEAPMAPIAPLPPFASPPAAPPLAPIDTFPASVKIRPPVTDTADWTPDSFTWNSPVKDSVFMNIQRQIQQLSHSEEWKKYQKQMQEYAHKMQAHFNNEEWKKYQQDMKAYGGKIQKYFNTPEWKKQQEAIQQESHKMQGYFNSDEWKKHGDSLRFQAEKMKEYFKGDEWNQRMNALKQSISDNRPYMDSIIGQVNQKMAMIRKNNAMVVVNNNGRSVTPTNIVRMLKTDGLLKNDHKYSIRISDRGLYINGKKQDQSYFEKYHRLVGEGTVLEIKRKDDHLQSTVKTNSNHNESFNL